MVPLFFFFFFKQKTAYEIVSRDWSSDVCSSDLDMPALDFMLSVDSPSVTTGLNDEKPSEATTSMVDRKSVV